MRNVLLILMTAAAAAVLVWAGHRFLPPNKMPRPAESRPADALSGAGQLASVPASSAGSPIQLHDVTAETGIVFRHTDGSSGQYYIPETVTAGVATFDFDGDGLIDIYFPNGAPLARHRGGPAAAAALYRNLGGWRFADVTEAGRGRVPRVRHGGRRRRTTTRTGFPICTSAISAPKSCTGTTATGRSPT